MTDDLCIYLFARDGGNLAIKINNVKREFYTYATTINTVTVMVDGFIETQHHAWIYHKGARPQVIADKVSVALKKELDADERKREIAHNDTETT